MNGNIVVSKRNVIDLEALKDSLSVDNPAMIAFSKYSKGYGIMPEERLKFYVEEAKTIEIPRNTPTIFYTALAKEYTHVGVKDYDFKGILRDYQQEVIQTVKSELQESKGKGFFDFLLQMPCGMGKTITALYYVSNVVKSKSIIIVPSVKPGVEQWVSSVHSFLPTAKVISCPDKVNTLYRDCDIFVINVDRLVAFANKFPEDFWDSFGCTVFDEAHRDGAYTYLPMISRFSAKYRLALTATFRRRDNLHEILKFYFGKIHEVESQYKKAKIIPVLTGIAIDRASYIKEVDYRSVIETSDLGDLPAKVLLRYAKGGDYTPATVSGPFTLKVRIGETFKHFNLQDYYSVTAYREEISFTQLDSATAVHPFRTKLVITLLRKLLSVKRKTLFLAKRKPLLIKLHKIFHAAGVKSALIVGAGTTDPELKIIAAQIFKEYNVESMTDYASKYADIVFGIFQLANDSLDCPNLDTLVVHTPIRDLEQPIGRIERYVENKKDPIVLYLLDEVGPYRALFNASIKTAKGCSISPYVPYKKITSENYLLPLSETISECPTKKKSQ